MFQTLIPFHSIIRWLLVAGLVYSLSKSMIGVVAKSKYSKWDNSILSATSLISQVQLAIGFVLYFKSPLVTYLRTNGSESLRYPDIAFFGIYHILCMILAILLIIIGTAKTKKATTDFEKHKQTLRWFGFATVLIFLAIPWPFSPFVTRPYLRMF